MKNVKFKDENGTFFVQEAENTNYLYFPIAGEKGVKSAVTPNLGGDCKTDQNHFLLEPVSVENLNNNRSTRNFWCCVEGRGNWSVTGTSAEQEYEKFTNRQDETVLEAGFMWQKTKRIAKKYELEAVVTSFVPLDGDMEVMYVEITNNGNEEQIITPIAAIPVFGRSADNLRDHRHVTSLLNRIQTIESGVVVTPILSFDERGHQKNHTSYYVCGYTGKGENPKAFYPTVQEFIGEGGSYLNPEAVRTKKEGQKAGISLQGKEVMGGILFEQKVLKPEETMQYIVLAGIANSDKVNEIKDTIEKYNTDIKVKTKLEELKEHWTEKVNVSFSMSDSKTEGYLKWICFQPILRRIYGCSFLPYHDYGKGGRGWRDLWQDCLALLIMDPAQVKSMILSNYEGVRVDGTNATIIGENQGEFIADRNHITRVWMDHAFWPFVTTKLYMDQTGDLDILLEDASYFKDSQSRRGTDHDELWTQESGERQRTQVGDVYKGSILEHILLQNLCAFYDVGEHNHMRLHGADWNDALDMAWERGESVAFTCAYAGNLKDIANYLEKLASCKGGEKILIAKEMLPLLNKDETNYDDILKKRERLNNYVAQCEHVLSGEKIAVNTLDVKRDLESKADWMIEHIRRTEWVKDDDDNGWFNGYYDNSGYQVEGEKDQNIRMMLTSQVFSIMSGTATKEQITEICKSADRYLYDKKAGGYRLNTDFKESKFDLGRMFGFAYGEKENGAVFSHMTVMYANALYKRGFVKEGYKALQTLLETAMDEERSCMYPGLPEYFDNEGRGMYPYLTGAASWYMLTMITEVFGVSGNLGDMRIEPKLMAEQFNQDGEASMTLIFGERQFKIQIVNKDKKEYGSYHVQKAAVDGKEINVINENQVQLKKEALSKLASNQLHQIVIYIG